MVAACAAEISRLGLSPRVEAVQGDIRSWRSPRRFAIVWIPRGGIQLLASLQDIVIALQNLTGMLTDDGVLYLDIADPWSQTAETAVLLPDFMRFSDSRSITGQKLFDEDSEGLSRVRRRFHSTISDDDVAALLTYNLVSSDHREEHLFEARFRWQRVRRAWLRHELSRLGFAQVLMLGRYSDTPCPGLLDESSSRIVCICMLSRLRKP